MKITYQLDTTIVEKKSFIIELNKDLIENRLKINSTLKYPYNIESEQDLIDFIYEIAWDVVEIPNKQFHEDDCEMDDIIFYKDVHAYLIKIFGLKYIKIKTCCEENPSKAKFCMTCGKELK